MASELIQPGNHPQAHTGAAAEASARRDIPGDGPGKRERLVPGTFEEGSGGDSNHGAGGLPRPASNRHVIIKPKGDPETVEARSEIGRARRDSDGDLLHLVTAITRAERDAIVT